MNLYSDDQQESVYNEKKGRDLLRAKLITREQYNEILARARHNLARTGFFFRLIYFVFSLVFLYALLGYFIWFFRVRGMLAMSFTFIIFGAGAYAVAEWLAGDRRCYRYGLEEGLVLGAAALFMQSLYFGLMPLHPQPGPFAVINSLAAGALYYWCYKRFGFLYAACFSLYAFASLPLQLRLLYPSLSEVFLRLSLIAFFCLLFYLNFLAGRHSRFAFQQENNRFLQAVLFLGAYLAANTALFPPFLRVEPLPPLFHWSGLALTFIIPGAALFFGFRDKNRYLLDAGLIASLITLIALKLFFSLPYQAWDPLVLGAILIGVVLAAQRTIDSGKLPGYTTKNIMSPDTYGLEALAASLAAPNLSTPLEGPFSGGGSGGAGASRNF
jgi:hypothetical protein